MQVIGPFVSLDKAKEVEAEKKQSQKYAVVYTRPNPDKREEGYIVVCHEHQLGLDKTPWPGCPHYPR